MMYLGDFALLATVRVPWHTTAADGSSVTRATDGSLRIFKDNSVTQRASAAGITDSEDFDGLTGVHHVNVDLSDNDDPGFYAAGHDYFVVLVGAVIDGKTVNAVLAHFSIQNRYTSTGPTAAAIADAVWDETAADHVTAGSTGKAQADTLAAVDTEIAAVITTLATIAGYLDTEIAAIKAKTDNLPSDPADASDIAASHASLAASLALIKAVTDLFTAAQAELVTPPASNATPMQKLAWIFMIAKNKVTEDATAQRLYANDGATVVGTAPVSDVAGVFTRGKFV